MCLNRVVDIATEGAGSHCKWDCWGFAVQIFDIVRGSEDDCGGTWTVAVEQSGQLPKTSPGRPSDLFTSLKPLHHHWLIRLRPTDKNLVSVNDTDAALTPGTL